jgi:hypothetical protein
MLITDGYAPTKPSAMEQFIATVLGQAHRAAEMQPDEARAILHLAHRFADALALADPRFDRLRFIEDATQEPA